MIATTNSDSLNSKFAFTSCISSSTKEWYSLLIWDCLNRSNYPEFHEKTDLIKWKHFFFIFILTPFHGDETVNIRRLNKSSFEIWALFISSYKEKCTNCFFIHVQYKEKAFTPNLFHSLNFMPAHICLMSPKIRRITKGVLLVLGKFHHTSVTCHKSKVISTKFKASGS